MVIAVATTTFVDTTPTVMLGRATGHGTGRHRGTHVVTVVAHDDKSADARVTDNIVVYQPRGGVTAINNRGLVRSHGLASTVPSGHHLPAVIGHIFIQVMEARTPLPTRGVFAWPTVSSRTIQRSFKCKQTSRQT